MQEILNDVLKDWIEKYSSNLLSENPNMDSYELIELVTSAVHYSVDECLEDEDFFVRITGKVENYT